MEPTIGRSLKQGFLAANKSWAGIGAFAGSWIVILTVAIAAVIFTNPPPALFEQPTAETARLAPRTPEAAPKSEAAPTQTDLFHQLAAPTDATTSPQVVTAPTPPTQSPPPTRREALAQRDRLAGEWFGRAWPALLFCVLLLAAASLWLNGGQVGYIVTQMRGATPAVSEVWLAGARVFGALAVAALLSLAALTVLTLAGVLLIWLMSILAGLSPGWVSTLLAIVSVLIALAGVMGLVWLAVRLSVWFIGIVADRLRPIAALRQSVRLTRGRWWRLAGLGVLTMLISYGVWVPVGILEWLGNLAGGVVATGVGVLGNLLGLIASLYVGFAAMGAYVCFYEDAKTASGPVI